MALEINRKKYQEIRKMDHTQMSKLFNKVYQEGYEAGKSDYCIAKTTLCYVND